MMNQRNYGATDTASLLSVNLDDERIEMDRFNGGSLTFDIDDRVYQPTTIPCAEILQRSRGLTRNQKIALFALAVVVIGGALMVLLSYFLSDKTLPVIPTATPPIGPSTTTLWTTTTDITTSTASTTTPFMTTTTTPTTTTGTTADPRCAFEPECCDAGKWICG